MKIASRSPVVIPLYIVQGITVWYGDFSTILPTKGCDLKRATNCSLVHLPIPVVGSGVMFAERTNPTAKFSAPVALPGLAGLGVTLSRDGSELYLCQNNGAPAYYDVYVTRFAGLTTDGIASTTGVMRVHYRDPGAGGKVFLGALSLGSTPGFPLDTRTVPLNVDGLLLMSIGGLSARK